MSRLLDLRRRLAFSRRCSLLRTSTTQVLAMLNIILYKCIDPPVEAACIS
jgi:hypothetical protein